VEFADQFDNAGKLTRIGQQQDCQFECACLICWCGGAWPLVVRGLNCLINFDNERDQEEMLFFFSSFSERIKDLLFFFFFKKKFSNKKN